VAPTLTELIGRILVARRARTGASPPYETPWETTPEFRLPTFPLKGCLVRLVSLALVLLVLAVVAMFLLVGGVMQSFGASIPDASFAKERISMDASAPGRH